ncbi:hypothetical protein RQ000_02540, partial [Streptococcus pneumoniae]|nr:hypothetical protein [Streptococcus pneumoniae]MDT5951395.1 hypothetical protein [Streptococcus pneumoniae]
MGLFFYTKIGSIISIGDLPTTNIIEPKSMDIKTKKQALRKLGKPYFKLFLASSPLHFKVRDKRFNGPFYLAIG